MKKVLYSIALLIVSNVISNAQVSLVKDIIPASTGQNSSYPSRFIHYKGYYYFVATTTIHGRELWRTDGTEEGTSLFYEFYPGQQDGEISNMIIFKDTLFLVADNGYQGSEIWITNGSYESTKLFKDINIGFDGSEIDTIIIYDSHLYFDAKDQDNGKALWKSDGTVDGTEMFFDMNPASESGSFKNPFEFNDELYFAGETDDEGVELWKTNGTVPGTQIVKDINVGTGSSSPNSFMIFLDKLVFRAYNSLYGTELWITDGTSSGTNILKDLRTGTSSSSPNNLIQYNNKLYFTAYSTIEGYEVFVSDSTESGTSVLKDIVSGTGGSYPNNLFVYNDTLFFTASDGVFGTEIWKSDGTEIGTDTLKDICSGVCSSYANDFVEFNNKLYFQATNTIYGYELWSTDGTNSGTNILKDNLALTGDGGFSFIEKNSSFIYFLSNNGSSGNEIYRTDGDSGIVELVKDMYPGSGSIYVNVKFSLDTICFFSCSNGEGYELGVLDLKNNDVKSFNLNSGNSQYNSFPSELTAVNGQLFFSASNLFWGDTELWKSDGSELGTNMVKDIRLGSNSSDPEQFIEMNSFLFFSANDGISGIELWRSDGTESGTELVKDIFPGASPSNIDNIVKMNGSLYFTANDASTTDLWTSGGTEGTTVSITGSDINPSELFVTSTNKLLFVADDPSVGYELWTSNGTTGGTVNIDDFNAGNSPSNPRDITEWNGMYYMSAETDLYGREVWYTNGGANAGSMLKDIHPTGGSDPFNFTPADSQLFFIAQDLSHGYELWVSDGTEGGTHIVKDINVGEEESNISEIITIKDKAVFIANDGVNGELIWVSDGTSTGTQILTNSSGQKLIKPTALYKVEDYIFICAYDPVNLYSIWRTDGTNEGTVRLEYPGNYALEISEMEMVDTILYFSCYHGEYGHELWKFYCSAAEYDAVYGDTVCEGESAQIIVECPLPNVRYQWQNNATGSFIDIEEGSVYSNVNSDTLEIIDVTGLDGVEFRCVLDNYCYFSTYTASVSLVLQYPPVSSAVLDDVVVCSGNDETLSVNPTGSLLNYQWQIDTGAGFIPLSDNVQYSGTNTKDLLISRAVFSQNEYQYRCSVTGVCSPEWISNSSTLFVDTVIILQQPIDTTVCQGGIANFSIETEGINLTYQWLISDNYGATYDNLFNNPTYSGVDTKDLTITKVAETMNGFMFGCRVSSVCMTDKYSFASILEVYPNPTPEITQEKDLYYCSKDSVEILTTEYYQDYQWSNNTSNEVAKIKQPGVYQVTVTDFNGCEGNSGFYTVLEREFPVPELCIVTVDFETGLNLVVWEKENTEVIDKYVVYRQGNVVDVYDPVGSVDSDSLSVLLDLTADQTTKEFFYKLSGIDSCGNESDKSPYHKPLFLQYNGFNEGVNLTWQPYKINNYDQSFESYIILRGMDSTALQVIDTVAGNSFVYTDKSAEAISNKVYYRVAGIKTVPCDPANLMGKKANNGPFSRALSNIEDNRQQASWIRARFAENKIQIYPNPMAENALVLFSNPENTLYTLSITNMAGEVVRMHDNISSDNIIISREGLESGLYIMKLNGDKVYTGKLIVE